MDTLKTLNGHTVYARQKGKFIVGTIMKKPPEDDKVLRSEVWLKDGRASAFNPTEWDLLMGSADE